MPTHFLPFFCLLSSLHSHSDLISLYIAKTSSSNNSNNNNKDGSSDKNAPSDRVSAIEVLAKLTGRGTFVWAWGAGYLGQLGMELPRGKPKTALVPIKLPDFRSPIRQIACGGNHSAALADDGTVFLWGDSQHDPTPVATLAGITAVKVACGQFFIAVLTDRGQVLTWSSPKFGGSVSNTEKKPKVFENKGPPGVRFVDISCGDRHAAAVSDTGVLYAMGSTEHHQAGPARSRDHGQGESGGLLLGPNSDQDRDREEWIHKLTPVSFRSQRQQRGGAGGDFSATGLVEEKTGEGASGDKYTVTVPSMAATASSSSSSSLSPRNPASLSFTSSAAALVSTSSSSSSSSAAFAPVSSFANAYGPAIVSVACGAIHSACVTDKGEVYFFGFGENFVLSGTSCFFETPVRLPCPEPIHQIACGQGHILGLSSRGDVYYWGEGSAQRRRRKAGPALFKQPRVVLANKSIAQIAAGRYHSIALNSYGVLYSWGSGENGQLGHGSDSNVALPTVVESIVGTVVGQVACGENHSIALASKPFERVDAEVIEWLKGERRDPKRAEQARLRDIAAKEEAAQLAASAETHIVTPEEARMLVTEELKQQEAQGLWHGNTADEKFVSMLEYFNVHRRDRMALSGDPAALLTQIGGVSSSTSSSSSSSATAAGIGASGYSGMGGVPSAGGAPGGGQRPKTSHGGPNGFGSSGQVGGRGAPGGGKQQGGDGSGVDGLILPPVSGAGAGRPSTATGLPAGNGPNGGQAAGAGQGGAGALVLSNGPAGGAGAGAGGALQASSQPSAFPRSRGGNVVGQFLRDTSNLVEDMRRVASLAIETPADTEIYQKDLAMRRREYDELRILVEEKKAQLNQLRHEFLQTEASRKSMESAGDHYIAEEKRINMKLSTTTIHINETSQNKTNYRVNITHLKEEDLDRNTELRHLRRERDALDLMLRRAIEAKVTADTERDRALSEKTQFENEIGNYKAFMKDQFGAFESIHKRAEQRERDRRAAREVRETEMSQRWARKVEHLHMESQKKIEEAQAKAQELNTVNERKGYFERRFRQIVSATGLQNTDDIINKFLIKEKIREGLEQERNAKKPQIEALRVMEADLRRELQQLQDTHEESRWKDVDKKNEDMRLAVAAENKFSSLVDRASERLALAQEGLVALLTMLPPDLAPEIDRDNAKVPLLTQGGPREDDHDEDSVVLTLEQDRKMSTQETVEGRTLHILRVLDLKLADLRERVRTLDAERTQREEEDRERRRLVAEQTDLLEKLKNSATGFEHSLSRTR